MSESFTFRKAVNGFNREDVISYISSVLEEKEALLRKVARLEADEKKQHGLINSLNNQISELNSTLSNRNDKCASCDTSEDAKAQLGAAMLDAKRYGDLIIAEAQSKAASIMSEASADVQKIVSRAVQLSEDIDLICGKIDNKLGSVSEDMFALMQKLSAFGSEITLNKDSFNATSPVSFDVKTSASNAAAEPALKPEDDKSATSKAYIPFENEPNLISKVQASESVIENENCFYEQKTENTENTSTSGFANENAPVEYKSERAVKDTSDVISFYANIGKAEPKNYDVDSSSTDEIDNTSFSTTASVPLPLTTEPEQEQQIPSVVHEAEAVPNTASEQKEETPLDIFALDGSEKKSIVFPDNDGFTIKVTIDE